MNHSEAIESLRQKFTSGNSVPVERAVITRAEFEAVMAKAVPDGFVLVPLEPTEAMLDRAVSFALCVQLSSEFGWTDYMRVLWSRMISAVPKPEPKPFDFHAAFNGDAEAMEHCSSHLIGQKAEAQEAYCCEIGAKPIVCDDCEHWKPVRVLGEP